MLSSRRHVVSSGKQYFVISGLQIRTIRLKSYYVKIDIAVENTVLPIISKAFKNEILGFSPMLLKRPFA